MYTLSIEPLEHGVFNEVCLEKGGYIRIKILSVGEFIAETCCMNYFRGVMRSATSSYMQQCVWWLVAPCVRHSVRMTYRPSAALRLLGSLRISHKKFHV